jgi:threonine dehydrogenase-like Zn-dependent dehydrogenase
VTASAAVTVRRDGAGVVLIADLPPGRVAFVDGDAVDHATADPVDAIVLEDDEDAPRRAAHAFAAVGEAVIEVLRGQPVGPVEVPGNGLLARLVRSPLGTRAASGPGEVPPVAIVDTSGSPDLIADALRRLDELGTLVLAGQASGTDLRLNLYTDLHRRSLTVAGVPAPALNGSPPDHWQPPLDWAQAEFRRVLVGATVPRGASWYLVEPRDNPSR